MRAALSTRKAHRQLASAIEALENRRLMSSTVVPDPGGSVVGTLVVAGTGGDDVITIECPAGQFFEGAPITVTVNGQAQQFEQWTGGSGSFNSVRVDAGDGNDQVTIGEFVRLPVTLIGGAGDDTLYGGSGDDLIVGGPGEDAMDGMRGIDEIVGEAGAVDAVHANTRLVIHGTSGDDNILVGYSDTYPPVSIPPDMPIYSPVDSARFAVYVGDSVKEFGNDVWAIEVHGGDGGDRIEIPRALWNGWMDADCVAVQLFGEVGDDTLIYPDVDRSATTLSGGDGQDTINSDAGTDLIERPAVSDDPSDQSIDHPHDHTPIPPAELAVVTRQFRHDIQSDGAAVIWGRNGLVKVRGTAGDDVVSLWFTPSSDGSMSGDLTVEVNGFARALRFANGRTVRRVVLHGRAGNDQVAMIGTAVPVTFVGGKGDDSYSTYRTGDIFRGGPGQDSTITPETGRHGLFSVEAIVDRLPL